MVDALASGASVLRDVEVQVLSRVPDIVVQAQRGLLLFVILYNIFVPVSA